MIKTNDIDSQNNKKKVLDIRIITKNHNFENIHKLSIQ